MSFEFRHIRILTELLDFAHEQKRIETGRDWPTTELVTYMCQEADPEFRRMVRIESYPEEKDCAGGILAHYVADIVNRDAVNTVEGGHQIGMAQRSSVNGRVQRKLGAVPKKPKPKFTGLRTLREGIISDTIDEEEAD